MADNNLSFDKALAYAAEKHNGQFRIGGEKYITHPVAVAEILKDKGFPLSFQIAALFHDLLEDTDAAEDEILALSNDEILQAVKLLTKQHGYKMEEYVGNIRQNEMAFAVKGADRLHNLRSALKTDEEFKRKYILETIDWYLDFSPEIPPAVKALAASLKKPLSEYPFLYEPIDTWKI